MGTFLSLFRPIPVSESGGSLETLSQIPFMPPFSTFPPPNFITFPSNSLVIPNLNFPSFILTKISLFSSFLSISYFSLFVIDSSKFSNVSSDLFPLYSLQSIFLSRFHFSLFLSFSIIPLFLRFLMDSLRFYSALLSLFSFSNSSVSILSK